MRVIAGASHVVLSCAESVGGWVDRLGRLFGAVTITDSALLTSAALCFGVPFAVVQVAPYLNFELGQRIMRLCAKIG